MRPLTPILLAAALVAHACGAAAAHEFWIDPVGQLAQPGPVATDLRVGQYFVGDAYPYISSKFNFLRVYHRGDVADVKGNEGDQPAVSLPEVKPGLSVVAFYGKPNTVVFTDPIVFLTYLTSEGLEWVLPLHRARGLPMTGFTEVFSRTVKTLIQVGPLSDEDRDQVVGMPLELVAGANPYAYPALKTLPVTLLWQDKPLAGTQISIFQDHGAIARSKVLTDDQGRASIPLADGGRFMINAVHMREAAPELQAAWESHWASLTFTIPKQ